MSQDHMNALVHTVQFDICVDIASQMVGFSLFVVHGVRHKEGTQVGKNYHDLFQHVKTDYVPKPVTCPLTAKFNHTMSQRNKFEFNNK